MSTELLRRAHNFISKAHTLDFREDRCAMWQIHLTEDIRAHLACCNVVVASVDGRRMAETGTRSVRSTTSAVPNEDSGDAHNA